MALYLVDLDQVELRALGSPPGTDVLAVDGTSAGMAFRDVEPVVEWHDGGRRLWLPIVDSAERVGVLAVTDDGTVPIADWLVLASLMGELVVSKEGYGDVISATRRRGPVSLAAELRWSLLPPLTFSSPALLISGILQPSHRVAGDAFDYSVGSHDAIVGIFDAMGHDLQAALLADMAIGGFRHARHRHWDPAAMLGYIDGVIAAQFPAASSSPASSSHSTPIPVRPASGPPDIPLPSSFPTREMLRRSAYDPGCRWGWGPARISRRPRAGAG